MGLGQGKVLSPDLVWYIENRIIAPLTANRMFFTREGIEVVKLYMYYGIINADEAKVSIAVNKIIALRDCTLFGQPTPKGLEEYYNWMLDIGEYRRVYDFDMAGKKRSLQGKDYPYDKLPYYQLMGKAIERDLIGFCEYCIRGV
jgi:hypothetical protein